MSVTKPVMWITGASSGIGRAVALLAPSFGYRVALTARRRDELDSLREDLLRSGTEPGDVCIAAADVTNRDELATAYSLLARELGSVDVLLANAGGHSPTSGSRFDTAEFRRLFELNVFGVTQCIELVLPVMQARRSGHIAGVSSIAGYRALPTAAAYGATKSALTYILESLRFDLERDGIVVSVISPGFVRTPLTDQNKFPMPCMIEADEAAQQIIRGIMERRREIHFPRRFTYLLKLLRILPQPLYHAIVRSVVYRGVAK
ncbi:MAG: SDR family NAD(P)-dependent oxidoreductase [Bdellovibrionota bacterium]